MYVLIGEWEGDYGDQYQRYREVVAVSRDKKLLEKEMSKTKEEFGFIEMVIEDVFEIQSR
jgi:hypothetical protein